MKNFIFIGMPAAGKSTVGVVVAKQFGYDFIDTDLLIQKTEGKLLKEIIAEVGLDGFLEVENRVNASVEVENSIIAPGGSVIYCEEAMRHLKENGIVVYLETSYQTIEKRLVNTKERGVVLRENQTLLDLYNERKILLEKYADIIVSEEGKSLDQTIHDTVEALHNYLEKEK